MADVDWHTTYNRCLGVYIAGTVIDRVDKRGKPVYDSNFLTLFNAHHERIDFLLPEFHAGGAWLVKLDTANAKHPFEQKRYEAGAMYPLEGRSMAVLTATSASPALLYRGGEKGAPATQPPVTGIRTPARAATQPEAETTGAPPSVPADAAPAKATQPLTENLAEDSTGG
jgi:hypothetical protein